MLRDNHFSCFTALIFLSIIFSPTLGYSQSDLVADSSKSKNDNLIINLEEIDSIQVYSSSGYYSSSNYTSYDRSSKFMIFPSFNNYDFVIKNYTYLSKETNYSDSIPNVRIIENEIRRIKNARIRRNALMSFFENLNQNIHPNDIISKNDKKEILNKSIKKGFIKEIYKMYDADWVFSNEYINAKERKEIFKSFRNMDSLSVFLETLYDTTDYYTLEAHVWNEINLKVYMNDVHFTITTKYPNTCGQPFYLDKEATSIIPVNIYNFRLNRILLNLLPKDFTGRSLIEYKNIAFEYIKFIGKSRGDLFLY